MENIQWRIFYALYFWYKIQYLLEELDWRKDFMPEKKPKIILLQVSKFSKKIWLEFKIFELYLEVILKKLIE